MESYLSDTGQSSKREVEDGQIQKTSEECATQKDSDSIVVGNSNAEKSHETADATSRNTGDSSSQHVERASDGDVSSIELVRTPFPGATQEGIQADRTTAALPRSSTTYRRSRDVHGAAESQAVCAEAAVDSEHQHGTNIEHVGVIPDTRAQKQNSKARPSPSPSVESRVHSMLEAFHISGSTLTTTKEIYLLKVCRGLMMYGAPTHRLEEYMHSTAQVLGLPLQSFYMPGCMIVSFNEAVWRYREVHIVRCTQALNLAKLFKVHAVYRDVIHGRSVLPDAIIRLDDIDRESDQYHPWLRVLMYGVASAFIGPVSYGARPIDLPFIFLLGSLLGFMELIVAPRSELYAHVFEITAAIVTSFLARAFGSIRSGRVFCFSAIAQASLVLILPGFTITTSALELQSKNIVSGSVRMVYGIIYTLFLAFGVTIGTTIYGAIDHNATSATQCSHTWPFWWQVIFVAPFTLCYIIINQGQWSRMPPMVIITLAAWLVNYFSSQRFGVNPQVPQALGALTAGIFANLYARLTQGLAVAILHPAIFIQVPGSFAAAGSLISGVTSADQINNRTDVAARAYPNTTALNAGYAMIEIAIGITVGLSVGVLLVYPLRKPKGKSGIFSF